MNNALEVSVQPGPVARLTLAGELGLAGAPRLLAAVGTLLRGAGVRRIEIDASLLRSCDAVGRRALASARMRAADHGVEMGFAAGAAGAAGAEESVPAAEPSALLCAS